MCGIAGYFSLNQKESKDLLHTRILSMTQALYRRGPDSGGLWIQAKSGLALGHRRLAIRDLSPLGHQPMCSSDGRYVLVYNGEVYNTQELKAQLATKNIYPKGTSDTEIILLFFMVFGIEKTLKNLLGMFALALWDTREKHLTIARDRFGVKPLYWFYDQQRFMFSSELKSFYALDDWHGKIDNDSLALFLRYAYIPAPYSIWQQTNKLEPAHRLDIDRHGNIKITSYWDSLAIAKEGRENPFDINTTNENVFRDELDTLLTDAVERRMVADVPVGSFLSGGIDSSLVSALMQKCSTNKVRTFSIGFNEADFNEAPYAKAVAKHLGTDHTEFYVSEQDAFDIVPSLPDMYDEPFADQSQIPTALLSCITRKHVTTVLSGDGGDELFAGYGRYLSYLKNVPKFYPVSSYAKILANSLLSIRAHTWENFAKLIPSKYRPRHAGARIHNFADIKLKGTALDYYMRYHQHYWWVPSSILRKGTAKPVLSNLSAIENTLGNALSSVQYIDTLTYLPEDILTKVDRASMYYSLETRVPLLDVRVYDFAMHIPENWRMQQDDGKYFLRKVLHKYIPKDLVERPKMGFGIPIDQWIRGGLRPFAEHYLSKKYLDNQGIFFASPLSVALESHFSEQRNWGYLLWIILMFQAWYDNLANKTTRFIDLNIDVVFDNN